MPTEEGVVEKIVKEKAVIRMQQSASCAHCESQGACHVLSDRVVRVEMRNDLEAKVGDVVQFTMPAGSVVRASLLVYFFPVVGLIAGAVAGGAAARAFHIDATLASILGGGFVMGAVFCVLRWLDRRSRSRDAYQPRMMRILSHESPS